MASSLKRYAVVGFMSEEDALSAMNAAIKKFQKRSYPFRDLSYCDGNIVYLHSGDEMERRMIEDFLLEQEGAQPKGCRCKI